MNKFKFFLDYLFNLIFPISCLSCEKEDVYLCEECFKKIKFLDKQVCHVCKKESPGGRTCNECGNNFYLDRVLVAAVYDELMEEIITQFKYRFSIALGEKLGQVLLNIISRKEDWSEVIFLPVPLHLNRLNYRGFNQAELLAKDVTRSIEGEYKDLLIRIKNTKPQANLKRKERLINLQNSFSLRDEDFDKNKIIVLIDDVISTGTTLNECAKVLKASGIKEVWGVVVARGN